MAELLEAVVSWPSLLLVLIVFGFAPGFCLRLIVLAYPRDDPRRKELIAELYAVPRIQRPVWVAEQLEVALFEGLGQRVSAVIPRLIGVLQRAREWRVRGHWRTLPDGRRVFIRRHKRSEDTTAAFLDAERRTELLRRLAR